MYRGVARGEATAILAMRQWGCNSPCVERCADERSFTAASFGLRTDDRLGTRQRVHAVARTGRRNMHNSAVQFAFQKAVEELVCSGYTLVSRYVALKGANNMANASTPAAATTF